MGIGTKIEWADSTVNPLMGCGGCELWNPKAGVERCYAGREARRRAGNKGWPARFDEPEFFPGRIEQAIRWPDLTGKERPDKPWLNGYPRLIFLDDLSDTFTEGQDPVEWLYPLVGKMAESPHIWMFLTKRPRRMREFFGRGGYSLRNFWLGTTVTGPETVGRIDDLLTLQQVAPDALLWLSLEPLVGPVTIDKFLVAGADGRVGTNYWRQNIWVVVGGESGPAARPMHPDWARSVRDACQAAEVPFFFKQNGEWLPEAVTRPWVNSFPREYVAAGRRPPSGHVVEMCRVGRRLAGRMLDGREWVEMPSIILPHPNPLPLGEEKSV
jgi:protein gp37